MLLPKNCIEKLQSSKMLISVEKETVHHFDDITWNFPSQIYYVRMRIKCTYALTLSRVKQAK